MRREGKLRWGKSPGFSIIELLVVIVILGLLVALLLPAVQQSREAARKTQCLSNLHQIGLAFQNYHDQHRLLPPGFVWGGPPGETIGDKLVGIYDRIARGTAPGSEQDRMYANWAVMLLPQLDQAALSGTFNPAHPIADESNKEIRTAELAVFKCPSDTYNGPDNQYIRDLLAGTSKVKHARGNYGMNLGPEAGCIVGVEANCTEGFHLDKNLSQHQVVWASGLGGVNYSISFKDIDRGASSMVAIDELRAGIAPMDPRGSWALGYNGASTTSRHGTISKREDDYGPNNQISSADDIYGCQAMKTEHGEDWPSQMRMPCRSPKPESNSQATSRSLHPGGVHVLLADGAARFVSDSINIDVWFKIHSRTAGPVSDW